MKMKQIKDNNNNDHILWLDSFLINEEIIIIDWSLSFIVNF